MPTKLDRTLKREILIGRDAYIVSVSPDGLKLTLKGRRNGLELAWKDLVDGEAALATALNASLEKNLISLSGRNSPPPKVRQQRRARAS